MVPAMGKCSGERMYIFINFINKVGGGWRESFGEETTVYSCDKASDNRN